MVIYENWTSTLGAPEPGSCRQSHLVQGLKKPFVLGKWKKWKTLFLDSNRISNSISVVCYLWADVYNCSWKFRNLWKICGLGFNTLSIAGCALQSLLFIILQIRGKESLSCWFLCFQTSPSLALKCLSSLDSFLEWGFLALGPSTIDLVRSRLQSRRQPENQRAECMIKHSTAFLKKINSVKLKVNLELLLYRFSGVWFVKTGVQVPLARS